MTHKKVADLLIDIETGLVGKTPVPENNVRRHGADLLESPGAGAGPYDGVRRRGKATRTWLGSGAGRPWSSRTSATGV